MSVLRRKRFVGELLMSLHGSPLSDTQLNSLALLALCKLPYAPAYAGDLVLRAGAQGVQHVPKIPARMETVLAVTVLPAHCPSELMPIYSLQEHGRLCFSMRHCQDATPLSKVKYISKSIVTLPIKSCWIPFYYVDTGLIPWLSIVANTALHSYETDPDLSRSSKHRRTAVAAAQLLLRLLHVRNWAKQGALLGPLADFGLAALSIYQCLAGKIP